MIPKERKLDQRSIVAGPAGEEREAEHEQEVPDDRAGERAADDFRQPLVDRDQGDDQLRRVAEGRVEEPADPRARVLGRVLGRLSDQPGERNQGQRREDEERRVADPVEGVEGDGGRPEGEAAEKNSSDHGSGLP